jgi:hypothetical protein
MRGVVIDEPELEFGSGGRHIDPRHGIMHWGPVDVGTDSAPSVIRVGVIGPEAAVEGIRSWLYRAQEPIEAKPPRYPGQAKLFPAFPGFDRPYVSLRDYCRRAQSSAHPAIRDS